MAGKFLLRIEIVIKTNSLHFYTASPPGLKKESNCSVIRIWNFYNKDGYITLEILFKKKKKEAYNVQT